MYCCTSTWIYLYITTKNTAVNERLCITLTDALASIEMIPCSDFPE